MPAVNKSCAAKWRGYAINVLLFVILVAGIRFWQQRDMATGVAPGLKGVTLEGHPYTLATQTDKPVLVHFWATWCSICRLEQDTINAIAHDDASVVTVAIQSGKPDEVSRYIQEQGVDFMVINDQKSTISRAWGVHAVPASFIISPSGKISFIEVGYTTNIGFKLRMWLAGL